MNFKGDYLRVLKPITSDGINIDIDDNNQVRFKEVEFPITAKRDLEQANEKLPKALKLRIEVVSPNAIKPAPIQRPQPKAPVVEEEDEFQTFEDEPTPVRKAGRPVKVNKDEN